MCVCVCVCIYIYIPYIQREVKAVIIRSSKQNLKVSAPVQVLLKRLYAEYYF